MIVDVARLDRDGERLTGEDPASVLELEGEDLQTFRPRGPIVYDVSAQVVSGELCVRGRLELDVAFRCSRCAEYFDARVAEPGFQAVRDITPQTEYVDLTGDMRESILVAFPSHPLCGEACKGLCAQCGTNLNRGTCSCGPPADGRWGALDNLNLD